MITIVTTIMVMITLTLTGDAESKPHGIINKLGLNVGFCTDHDSKQIQEIFVCRYSDEKTNEGAVIFSVYSDKEQFPEQIILSYGKDVGYEIIRDFDVELEPILATVQFEDGSIKEITLFKVNIAFMLSEVQIKEFAELEELSALIVLKKGHVSHKFSKSQLDEIKISFRI